MKIRTKEGTTIISGLVFIVLGIIFIDINRVLCYIFFGIGIIIEAFGVIDEIKDIFRKDNNQISNNSSSDRF